MSDRVLIGVEQEDRKTMYRVRLVSHEFGFMEETGGMSLKEAWRLRNKDMSTLRFKDLLGVMTVKIVCHNGCF